MTACLYPHAYFTTCITTSIAQTQPRTITTRSMHRIVKPKQHFNLTSSITPSPIPRNLKAALFDPNWKTAMCDEFTGLY